tara:strand:+ start:224 stop:1486 length:1263 start_codon:yes stop_codon:yes gene_type:complete
MANMEEGRQRLTALIKEELEAMLSEAPLPPLVSAPQEVPQEQDGGMGIAPYALGGAGAYGLYRAGQKRATNAAYTAAQKQVMDDMVKKRLAQNAAAQQAKRAAAGTAAGASAFRPTMAGLGSAARTMAQNPMKSVPAMGLRGLAGAGAGAYLGAKAAPYALSALSNIPGVGEEGGMSPDEVRFASDMGAQRIGSALGLSSDPVHSALYKRAAEKGWSQDQTLSAIQISDAGGPNTPEGQAILAGLRQRMGTQQPVAAPEPTVSSPDPVEREDVHSHARDVSARQAEDSDVDLERNPPVREPAEVTDPEGAQKTRYKVKVDPLVGPPKWVTVTIDNNMSADDVKRAAKRQFARKNLDDLLANNPNLTKRDLKYLKKAYLKAAKKMQDVRRIDVGPDADVQGVSLRETILRLSKEIREGQDK